MADLLSRLAAPGTALALSLAFTVSTSEPLQAQSTGLEGQRQAVFAQLLQAPTDRTLMLQYAQLSVQMRDYEAAAATLERFVDLYPEDAGARVELAAAYFALGANDVAEYHLNAVQNAGGLTAEQADAVTRYGDAAAQDDGQAFRAQIAVGQAWAQTADEDGLFGSVRLDWRVDLGDAHVTEWVTEFAYSTYLPGETSLNDRQVARLRTGPQFRFTGEAFGPRLQPYLEFESFRDATGPFGDYNAVALGLAYQNPHSAQWTSYADVQVGRADIQGASGGEFDFFDAMVGLAYRPARSTRIRASLQWRDADGDSLETERNGVRLEAMHRFQAGIDMLPRQWELRGYVDYAETEERSASGLEEYNDFAYGASLRAFVSDDIFVEARAASLERRTDGPDTDETVYALQIGWEF